MLILRDLRAGDNDTGSHNLPLSLCAWCNSLATCSCCSTSSVSYSPFCCKCGGGVFACSHTAGGNRRNLLPLPPTSALTLGRRGYRRLLVLWAASRAGSQQLWWLLAPLDVVLQLVLSLWRVCRSLPLEGSSSYVYPTQALWIHCWKLLKNHRQLTQPPVAGRRRMEPWHGLHPYHTLSILNFLQDGSSCRQQC